MYKLEIETYGGKVTVESDFLNFIYEMGELIERKQLAEVYGLTEEEDIQREACFIKREKPMTQKKGKK